MKNWLLALSVAILGLQSAFGACAGEVFFQAPKTWPKVYIYLSMRTTELTRLNNGFYHIDLAEAAQAGWGDDITRFMLISSETNPLYYTNSTDWNVLDRIALDPNNADFECPGEGKSLYILEDPKNPGKTLLSSTPPDIKYFFVLLPDDSEEWLASTVMISTDGGKTGTPMKADPDRCGWFYHVFYNEKISDNVVLYRDDDELREDMIGLNGDWETSASATPIPMGMIFSMDVDSLFFVAAEWQKTNDDGFYYSAAEVEGMEGVCSYVLGSLIYDTDASLHGAFTCYPKWYGGMTEDEGRSNDCYYESARYNVVDSDEGVVPCIGVTQGMVSETLGANKKPKLTAKGRTCFGSNADEAFAAMFSSTPDVNETTCFDMPLSRSENGRWAFNSDTYMNRGLSVRGGFYPVEDKSNSDVIAVGGEPLEAARTLRRAEGPIFYGSALREVDAGEQVPKFNLLCNGPGWNKGTDCEGMFFNADETASEIRNFYELDKVACVFGWSCMNSDAPEGWLFYKSGTETLAGTTDAYPQWTSSTGRNQHFCSETHAKFVYKKGMRFSIRGDDDIWVYIAGKLAVDLGGSHMAAPGYVNLDEIVDSQGLSLAVGDEYDFDMFFCDRRTTVSTMEIQTNMMLVQRASGITTKATRNPANKDELTYSICYSQSGDGSCVSVLDGLSDVATYCGEDILKNVPISYTLVAGNSINSPAVSGFERVTSPGVYRCGIDLTNLAVPKINVDDICLAAGRYTLFVNIENRTKKIATFYVRAELDVVYRDAVALDTNGNVIGAYKLTTTAMGGELIPFYVSVVAEPENSKDPLEILPEDAKSVQYTLSYDKLMKVYFRNGEGLYERLTSGMPRTIGESGIDTLYATVDLDDLTSSVQKFEIGVVGRPNTLELIYTLTPTSLETPVAQVGFDVRGIAHSALLISMGNAVESRFAVMDLQGRMVRQGTLAGTETVVPNIYPGSYIVKVGSQTRRVNIR